MQMEATPLENQMIYNLDYKVSLNQENYDISYIFHIF